MYLHRGRTYTNFAGTKHVRLVAIFLDDDGVKKATLANLRAPGGWSVMSCREFEMDFAEELEERPTYSSKTATDVYFKEQLWNPYRS